MKRFPPRARLIFKAKPRPASQAQPNPARPCPAQPGPKRPAQPRPAKPCPALPSPAQPARPTVFNFWPGPGPKSARIWSSRSRNPAWILRAESGLDFEGGFRLFKQILIYGRIPPSKSKPDSALKIEAGFRLQRNQIRADLGPRPGQNFEAVGRAGLGWAGLGWAGRAGLGWAWPGRAGLGWAGLGQAGPDWAGLDWADWSGPGSAPKMVKTNGKIQRISSSRLCPHRFSNRNNLCKLLSKEKIACR